MAPGPSGDGGGPTADAAVADSDGPDEASDSPDDTSSIDFAFEFPRRRGWRELIVSGVLLGTSFLLLPLFALIGYAYRVSRAAALGHPEPPTHDDWTGLMNDGLRFLGVALVFAVALVALTAGSRAVADAVGGERVEILLYLAVLAPTYYVSTAVLTAYVGADDGLDAVRDGRAMALLRSRYFARAAGWGVLLDIALLLFSTVLFIALFFTWAYAILVRSAYWGHVYRGAAERGIVPPPETE